MPDGAPALSMAKLMIDEETFVISGETEKTTYTVEYNVVAPTTIQAYVTGNDPRAAFAVLPVNAAAQLLGSGEEYKMLATLTHGNIYFVSAKYPDVQLTEANLDTLVGKKVGCIQLDNVVGLTLRAVLKENNIPFKVKEDVSATAESGVVNLFNISDPQNMITPAAGYDFMVAAEPSVSAKIKMTAGNEAGKQLKLVGDLQKLYGEGGYPQAVLVAKKVLIEAEPLLAEEFAAAVNESCEWVNADDVDVAAVIKAVADHLPDGATPSFSEKNLTADVIANCAISYVSAAEGKEEVKGFLEKLASVGATLSVKDDFFYNVE